MSRPASPRTSTSAAAQWAMVSGAAGLVAGLTLLLFFALAAPVDSEPSPWDWLGPANDLTGALQSAALVPVALALLRSMPESAVVRAWTRIGVPAMAVGAALGLALVLGLIPFPVQAPLVTFCIFLQFGWLFAVSRAGLRLGVLPSVVAKTGMRVSVGLAAAAVLVLPALLLPRGSIAQYLVFGVAAIPGVVAWLGFPAWAVLLARRLPSL